MKPRISVAIVAHDMVPMMFAYDLANLMAFTSVNIPDDWTFGINLVKGTYVHSGRDQMLRGTSDKHGLIGQGITHVLWIDADMRFPRDAFFRLLKHDLDVVGINYCTRGAPSNYVALKKVGTDEDVGYKLETTKESTGVEEVEGIGFGMVLMKTKIVDKLPADKPWFWFEWMPKRQAMVGEDIYFCNLLREAGVKIHVDHDLSKQCGHLGEYEYNVEDVWATKEVLAGV